MTGTTGKTGPNVEWKEAREVTDSYPCLGNA